MERYLFKGWERLVEAGHLVKFFFFFGLASLIRLPFFFRDYIDRDESTFILLGQSLVDGHLPYTELWDLKPPLLFFLFAGIIGVFGKSFIAIRLSAVLMVALTALLTFIIAKRLSRNTTQSLIAGILSIYLASLFGSMQGLMSEHISTLFFMLCMYLVLGIKNPKPYLLAGLCLGMALMVKTNLAYSFLLLLFFLAVVQDRKRWRTGMVNASLLGVGVILVIGLTFIPYAMQGLGSVWLDSVYHAPLAYTANARDQIMKVVPLGVILAALLWISWRYKFLNWKDKGILLIILMLVGIVFSFFRTGKINGHYLIQIYPLALILLVTATANFNFRKSAWIQRILLIVFLLAPVETYKESIDVIRHKAERGTFFNGEGILVPAYLTQENLLDKDVFFLEYHIGYWLIEQKPPTKAATHPSNICRAALFPYYNPERRTALEEIRYIMEHIEPEIVVIRKGKAIFDKDNEEENDYVTAYLDEHYSHVAQVDNALILIRSKNSGKR